MGITQENLSPTAVRWSQSSSTKPDESRSSTASSPWIAVRFEMVPMVAESTWPRASEAPNAQTLEPLGCCAMPLTLITSSGLGSMKGQRSIRYSRKGWMAVEMMVAWPAERQVSKQKSLQALTTQQVWRPTERIQATQGCSTMRAGGPSRE